MTTFLRRAVIACLVMFGLSVGPALAQQFVYTPQNPAFGGSPANAQWMMSVAEAQADFDEGSFFQRDPLQDFEQGLQRQVLNQLSRELVAGEMGDHDFSQGGSFELGQFNVDVSEDMRGLNVRIFDPLTGDETVVTVPSF